MSIIETIQPLSRKLLIPLFGLFLASCIDPLETVIDDEVNILIVEGSVTTKAGPQEIRLTQSARYGGISDGFVRPLHGATVVIRDSDGINFPLTEKVFEWIDEWHRHISIPRSETAGIYITADDFSAVVGKTYTLLITTTNGIEYTSLPEKVIQGAGIQELNVQFNKIDLGNNNFRTGFKVDATFRDRAEEQNYYLWRNSGTYQALTFPQDYVVFDLGSLMDVPAPKDCCEICWVTEFMGDNTLRVLSDNNVNGNSIIDQAAFIKDDGLRFGDKYLVRIELHTLNREAFQFFDLVRNQQSINGDIFDPPPATIRGNMINLTNPDENVIGYFRASDVTVDSIFILKEMLQAPSPYLRINNDCRTYKAGITEEPSYW